MQGMNFGMDGPAVTGWWYNPQTGDKFNAIDTYFEDNNLLIKTADNRLLNFNQIQNYLHVEDEKSIPDFNPTKKQPIGEELPPEVQAIIEQPDEASPDTLIIPDDDIYGGTRKIGRGAELGNIYKKEELIQQPTQTSDFDIITRALFNKQGPKLTGDIYWDEYPQREIEMLIDVMNISEEEIIEYYINNLATNDIIDTIKGCIRDWIKKNLHPVTTSGESSGTQTVVGEVGDKSTGKRTRTNKSNK